MSHDVIKKKSGNQPLTFPKSLYLVMVLALCLMFAYSLYGEKPTPEQVVTQFWTSYFNKDYDTVVKDLSVAFLVQTNPEYMSKNYSDWVQARPALEATARPIIQQMREGYDDPLKPEIIILDKYSQTGNVGGIVFFQIKDGEELMTTQVALIIYENEDIKLGDIVIGQKQVPKIFGFSMTNEQWLAETSSEEMKKMFVDYESQVKQLMESTAQSSSQPEVQPAQ